MAEREAFDHEPGSKMANMIAGRRWELFHGPAYHPGAWPMELPHHAGNAFRANDWMDAAIE
jgi:hypothetical protein